MKRAHPLALAFFLLLFFAVYWLNNESGIGIQLFDSDYGSKYVKEERIGNPYVLKGWPFQFWSLDAGDRLFSFPPAILSAMTCLTLSVFPAYTLHRLLRRTLQIHLVTAVALTLTASSFLALNLRAETIVLNNPFATPEQPMRYSYKLYGWPQISAQSRSEFIDAGSGMVSLPDAAWNFPHLVGNILIALAILSSVLLLSEFLIRRRIPEGGKQ